MMPESAYHWLYIVANLQTGGGDQLLLSHVRAFQNTQHKITIASLQPWKRAESLVDDFEKHGASVHSLSNRHRVVMGLMLGMLNPLVWCYAIVKRLRGIKIIETHRSITGRLTRYIYGAFALRELERSLKNGQFQGIHVFHATSGLLVHKLLPKITCVKLYTEISSPAGYGQWTEDISPILQQFTRVIVPAKTIGAMLDPTIPISIVPFSLDSVTIDKTLIHDTPTFGVVSRLSAEKAIDHLIRATAIIRNRIPNARLVIAGTGPLRGELEQLTTDLSLKASVTFLGRFENVADVLSMLDVFVLCSQTEGMPLSILEAMSAGLPVVATRVGAVPDLVEPGVNGYIVEPGDITSLANRIVELLADHKMRMRMGERSRELHEERFAFRVFQTKIRELYDSLVGASAKP